MKAKKNRIYERRENANKTAAISFRATKSQERDISEKAAKTGLSRSQFILQATLNGNVQSPMEIRQLTIELQQIRVSIQNQADPIIFEKISDQLGDLLLTIRSTKN